ncbi:MAG: Dps family protein [Gemmobacter sp.]
MTNPMKVVPEETAVGTGVSDPAPVAEELAGVLADTYRLIFKTHACHWNVEGPLFHPIHVLTESQYEEMFAAADVLAERIRALGRLAPSRFAELSQSRVEDFEDGSSARDMVAALAADHEALARRLHGLIDLAGDHGDPVTEDLATARSAFHEKAAWMLRATAK